MLLKSTCTWKRKAKKRTLSKLNTFILKQVRYFAYHNTRKCYYDEFLTTIVSIFCSIVKITKTIWILLKFSCIRLNLNRILNMCKWKYCFSNNVFSFIDRKALFLYFRKPYKQKLDRSVSSISVMVTQHEWNESLVIKLHIKHQ